MTSRYVRLLMVYSRHMDMDMDMCNMRMCMYVACALASNQDQLLVV